MEPYENNEFESIPELQESAPAQPQPGTYHAAGTGRKESPYANSPYEMNRPQEPEYHYQPQYQAPKKPKKEKKARRPLWRGILAGVLALVLVAGSCLVTAICVTEYWEERTEDTVEMLTDKIEALEQQGYVKRIYGGVMLSRHANSIIPLDLRDPEHSAIKDQLARRAAALIPDGATVLLDASSTTRRIIRHLSQRHDLKIITNNLRLLHEAPLQ